VTESRLPRTLGTWTATAVVVGTIVGSGIFRLPGPVAAQAGSAPVIVLLWAVGGLVALCGALSLAEMAAAYPRTGGMYVVLRETYGKWAAFLFGWAMLVINPAAYAFVALISGESLAALIPALRGWERPTAAAALVGLVAINIRPVRFGAVVLNAVTWAKVAMLVVLSSVAMRFAGDANTAAASLAPDSATPPSWSALGLALILVMGAYDGWQWVPQLAGEMRHPARSLPRALGVGVLVVIAVYLMTNTANLLVLAVAGLETSMLPTSDVARRLAGGPGASFAAALIALSTFGSNHAGMMTDPRVFFAMAEDGLFVRAVAAVHPRHRTPYVAIALIGAGGIIYLFVRTLEELVGTLILGMWPFLALTVAAVIVQRRRQPDLIRPYRVPLYPILPLVFLTVCAGLFASSLVEQPLFTLVNIAVLVAGLPVYWVWRRV
jgi:amino acid transporter